MKLLFRLQESVNHVHQIPQVIGEDFIVIHVRPNFSHEPVHTMVAFMRDSPQVGTAVKNEVGRIFGFTIDMQSFSIIVFVQGRVPFLPRFDNVISYNDMDGVIQINGEFYRLDPLFEFICQGFFLFNAAKVLILWQLAHNSW